MKTKNQKLKERLGILLTGVFIMSIVTVNYLVNHTENERTQYERFLVSSTENHLSKLNINEEKKPGVSNPELAGLQEYLNTVDPQLGRVPKERLKEAYQNRNSYLPKTGSKTYQNIIWNEVAANMGGRCRAIMWDPNDPSGNKAWAGCVTGGLWKNNNITSDIFSWIPVDDFWPQLSVSSLTYDPNNTQKFYAGTGEAETSIVIYRESTGVGCGIMMSEDGGDSWEIMPGTEDFEYVVDVKVRDENGTSVVYAAVACGIYMGSPHMSEPSCGLYRFHPEVEIWEQVLPNIIGLDQPYTPSDIEFGADGRIYIGTLPNVDGEGGGTILFSDEGTEGSWTIFEDYKIQIENTPEDNLPGRVILAIAPSDENVVYALIAQGGHNALVYYRCDLLAKSTDKGNTWTTLNHPPNDNYSGNTWAYIAWHTLTAAVNPSNAQELYVGALELNKTINDGMNWDVLSDWTKMYSNGGSDYIHGDLHQILFKPGSDYEVIISTDGGIFYCENIVFAPIFEERNNGFNTLQTYKCAMSPTAGTANYIGGFQDNCSVLYNGEPVTISDIISGGDGGCCFWDENNPEIYISSYQYNKYKIFNNGIQYLSITNFFSGNFISAADYDYNLNSIYANAAYFHTWWQDSIFRINNIGPDVSVDFMGLGTGSIVPFTSVKYSPYSPEGTSTLFLGTQSGRLFKCYNAHDIPETIEIGSTEFPTATISSIAIGGSEDTLLVSFSNYGVPSVWRTFDGGESWQDIEGNLPDIPIRWNIFHPDNSAIAMLATELGIFVSGNVTDQEVFWEINNTGLANVRVDMLQLRKSDNTVLAATHGRGLFTTTFDFNPTTKMNIPVQIEAKVYPNPTQGLLNIDLKNPFRGYAELELYNQLNQLIRSYSFHAPESQIQINLSDLAAGNYTLKLRNNKAEYSTQIIKR